MDNIRFLLVVFCILSVGGCASVDQSHDYTEFRNATPGSILVLPPINHSPEVLAPFSLLAQTTYPVAESGFYVYPAALVYQTFNNNGLTVAEDIHQLPIEKLHEVFGADAALYIIIENYGTSYAVLSSDTVVRISARLVDLRTGVLLWSDSASASSAETRGNGGNGLAGMLVEAAINQIVETVTDKGFEIAAIATSRLLDADLRNGLLYGPRSLKYGQPAPSEKK